ncbi:hypothetical protein BGM09_29985 [Streptomyces sp. CBMA29]|nr:hypothetical protein [Streptomyces sp. CBMA29]
MPPVTSAPVVNSVAEAVGEGLRSLVLEREPRWGGPRRLVSTARRCDSMTVLVMGAAQTRKFIQFTSVASG